MGTIRLHEFISLDGVIDTPTWTAESGFDPKRSEAIGGVMGGCQGILLAGTASLTARARALPAEPTCPHKRRALLMSISAATGLCALREAG